MADRIGLHIGDLQLDQGLKHRREQTICGADATEN